MDDQTPKKPRARTQPARKPPRYRQDGLTPKRQETFLKALAENGSVVDACAAAGISSTSAYRARDRIEGFARRWDAALAKVRPKLEEAAYKRAVEGWEEPIYQNGKLVGMKKRFSDSLLKMLVQRETPPPDKMDEHTRRIALAEVEAVLIERIEVLERDEAKKQARADAAARAAAVAQAERMRREGRCP